MEIIIRLESSSCRYVDEVFVAEFIEHGDESDYQRALISMKKRYNLWENAEHIAFDRIDYDDPFPRKELRRLIPDELLKIAGGTELSDLLYIIYGTETLELENIVQHSYPDDVHQCKIALMKLQESCGDDFFEQLLQLHGECQSEKKIF